jgi:hypothetical protein
MHRTVLFTLLILLQQLIFSKSFITSYTYPTDDCSGDSVLTDTFANGECVATNSLFGVSTKTTCPTSETGTRDHLLIQTFADADCSGLPVTTLHTRRIYRFTNYWCLPNLRFQRGGGEDASVKYDCSYGNRIIMSSAVMLAVLAAWIL